MFGLTVGLYVRINVKSDQLTWFFSSFRSGGGFHEPRFFRIKSGKTKSLIKSLLLRSLYKHYGLKTKSVWYATSLRGPSIMGLSAAQCWKWNDDSVKSSGPEKTKHWAKRHYNSQLQSAALIETNVAGYSLVWCLSGCKWSTDSRSCGDAAGAWVAGETPSCNGL